MKTIVDQKAGKPSRSSQLSPERFAKCHDSNSLHSFISRPGKQNQSNGGLMTQSEKLVEETLLTLVVVGCKLLLELVNI